MGIPRYDSRLITPGDHFICLPSGEAYCQDAIDNGASKITPMSRRDLADFASEFYQHPSHALCVIGITGTNGKTTVSFLVHTLLTLLGNVSYLSGTLTHSLTTPESLDTQAMMASHRQSGGTHYVMEVSSHGIHQERIRAIDFDITCLTNISQDHLDYHETFDSYKNCKLSFLAHYGRLASFFPDDFLSLDLPKTLPLLGQFNRENIQAALTIVMALGYSYTELCALLPKLSAPPGRFDSILPSHPFTVIVDYAHTPDALENVLQTCRTLLAPTAQLFCVFGCGGNRDTGKRPSMGRIASQYSDHVILTNDNPRDEDPDSILRDIQSGMEATCPVSLRPDRRLAIAYAISKARTGDLILIAGKGHETTQQIGTETIPFDDREVALSYLKGPL